LILIDVSVYVEAEAISFPYKKKKLPSAVQKKVPSNFMKKVASGLVEILPS